MKVLFFGMLKDMVGRAEDQLDLETSATLGGVFDHYSRQFPRLREMAGSILLARNQEFAAPATQIADGDEIAFLPPVSGGAPSPARDLGKRAFLRADLASYRHAQDR